MEHGIGGAQAAFGMWADRIGPYAGGGAITTGTALMALGTATVGDGTASGLPAARAATASYFPKIGRPLAPAQVWGLGARRRPELVARLAAALLAPAAQRALAVAVQAGPVAQRVAGFRDWLPRGEALPQRIEPVTRMEPGTAAIGSPGALSDPEFSDVLYSLRRADKQPTDREAALAALTSETQALNSCISCWTG